MGGVISTKTLIQIPYFNPIYYFSISIPHTNDARPLISQPLPGMQQDY